MRKSREEAAETRARIIRRASKEFNQHGIAGTGLADVMKSAGLTHGGFYKHFQSKTNWSRPHRVGYGLTGWAPTYAASMRSKPVAEPLRQLSANDCDMGSGKMSSSSFSTPSRMARATDSGEAFGMSKPRAASVSTGPVRKI